MDDATRKQVADQCRAVAHMAKVIAQVHADYAKMFDAGCADAIHEIVGRRTAEFLEELGDMLNGMDAVTEEDEWVNPIIREAQRRWQRAS